MSIEHVTKKDERITSFPGEFINEHDDCRNMCKDERVTSFSHKFKNDHVGICGKMRGLLVFHMRL